MTDDDQLTRPRPTADESGFRQWVAARAVGLRRKAYLMCGDWHAADDLVQDTLVSLYTSWPRVARGSNVDAYASRVLAHKFIDDRRRPWRRHLLTPELPDRHDRAAELALDQVDNRDGPLAQALAILPPQQRVVIVLRYTDDLPVEEIARALDLPSGTVKSRLSRGIQALHAELTRTDHGDSPATTDRPLEQQR